ncbi:UTP--glucose-1-phosphate uridylyltransferase [Nanchangia anserum]|uniref:UTP--glucose-1-phosphate uridylyltransferase n=1 Tax=Nanchangia anserum TaxID=2692125 RepID=A0A8I0GC20_9ACTO|nr:UTP--glucose-1-phosphate uridylyltransferase [Nanchangia anserum]MBD3689410.1 UTP--glucose-1-phosphate uridylyltransferase [Nanchangia anserum]QOX81617.1 UTP--glucose-1-phosphate uridylyltransferase [Nanchangia anserum]
MSEHGLAAARDKMRDAGVPDQAITVFDHYYRQLESGVSGLILEADIDPLTEIDHLDDITVSEDDARDALAHTCVIKLNGGLGTSMGMNAPKSLLPVRDGLTFFDIICRQVGAARERYGVRLPLIFMNSFNTREQTLEAARAYPDLVVDDVPLDFVQNQEPKLTEELEPVEWPANAKLEWCPPGHGDIYVSLLATGILKQLLDAGYRYAFTSNSDNLGATPSPEIAAWFQASGAPYAAEVTKRTVTDLKGGHLVRRKSDGRLILRETAQIRDDEMGYFTDDVRHPYTHTNNLWLNLQAVYDQLVANDGVMGMPLIVNRKTVDPTDATSTPVIQMETAMGAAIEVFDGSTAIAVPRSRFLPVKTTAELTLVRSDLYTLTDDYRLVKVGDATPDVRLDKRYYKNIADYEARFPEGVPSLTDATSLSIEGDWTFGAGVRVVGDVHLGEAEAGHVDAGEVLQ